MNDIILRNRLVGRLEVVVEEEVIVVVVVVVVVVEVFEVVEVSYPLTAHFHNIRLSELELINVVDSSYIVIRPVYSVVNNVALYID